MKVFRTTSELKLYLENLPKPSSIGFVPTMGALHLGHKSLLSKALSENDICVCSIFVNPKQFNHEEDLKNYPCTIDSDYKMLIGLGWGVLFLPEYEEVYPEELVMKNYDFGHLDKVIEGVSRPGHFNGVAKVVSRFFDIINPNKAYFGEKDAQQLSIIKCLKKQAYPNIKIITCPTIREFDGLAMSSRNSLLSKEQRKAASRIYKILKSVKQKSKYYSMNQIKKWVKHQFSLDANLQLDYFEICDPESFISSKSWEQCSEHIGLIAVYIGNIRLIDNILIKIN